MYILIYLQAYNDQHDIYLSFVFIFRFRHAVVSAMTGHKAPKKPSSGKTHMADVVSAVQGINDVVKKGLMPNRKYLFWRKKKATIIAETMKLFARKVGSLVLYKINVCFIHQSNMFSSVGHYLKSYGRMTFNVLNLKLLNWFNPNCTWTFIRSLHYGFVSVSESQIQN